MCGRVSHNSNMADVKTKAVTKYLESVCADIESTIDSSKTRDHWRNLARGTLTHWLTVLFEEGAGYVHDLETSVNILHAQVEALKKNNSRLRIQHEALLVRLLEYENAERDRRDD